MTMEDIEDLEDDEADGHRDVVELFGPFIRMWPRAIFHPATSSDAHVRSGSIAKDVEVLKRPGVYILYRDDKPTYVGQTSGELGRRLESHAVKFSRRSYFWNYFSAFIVENSDNRLQLESLLIATMPSVLANTAVPRLKKVQMPPAVSELFKKSRIDGKY